MAVFFIVLLLSVKGYAAEPDTKLPEQSWKFTVGSGFIVAPSFAGSKNVSLLAVPDVRVAYKDVLSINMKDGISYAVIKQDRWRIGPAVTYTFKRSEKSGGSIFRIAGSGRDALKGMGDVEGTVSLGGMIEYTVKPFKAQIHFHKGINGHQGFVGEGGLRYGNVFRYSGPPVIYSFGPHIKFGDQRYINSYWGITPEQSSATGLDVYHAAAGITSYGIGSIAMMPLTRSLAVTIIAGFDRLAHPVAASPLIKIHGTANQASGGLFVGYRF